MTNHNPNMTPANRRATTGHSEMKSETTSDRAPAIWSNPAGTQEIWVDGLLKDGAFGKGTRLGVFIFDDDWGAEARQSNLSFICRAANGDGETFAREQVAAAAKKASDQIIQMVLRACNRKHVNGHPMVDGVMVGWDTYVSHVVLAYLGAES